MSVIAQGVPAHIGTPTEGHGYEAGEPYASFLPPAIPVSDDSEDTALRAVVFVRESTEKVGQEYIGPLLVVSGTEYATMSFDALHERICDALRGRRPRLVAEMIGSDGEAELMFDDGTVQPVRPQR
ncbi:MAG: hypothetical protein M3P06_02175 [Acidobacteriota bacterium]|nr:hypothetical protein [Acidobacteriota bacterium]